MDNVSVLLVGIGGYGGFTGKNILENQANYGIKVVGVVEPFPQNSPILDMLGDIPVYGTLEEFYSAGSAQLAVISTPIYLHEEQCIFCMEHGSDVLCEKPIAPTVQQAQNMQEASRRLGKTLNIGFQLSYTPSILKLKEDIPSFGGFKGASALVCWPRNKAYFDRPWAAKEKFNGMLVLDSVAMNACAHYLHNLLFLLGEKPDEAALPSAMRCALARANDIEMYDTAAFEAVVNGASVDFLVTHASEKTVNPLMYLMFEKATVYIFGNDDDNAVFAQMNDGSVKEYGATAKAQFNKFPYCAAIARGERKPICTVKTALPHLKCVNAASLYCSVATAENVTVKDGFSIIPHIDDVLIASFARGKMPWELTYGDRCVIDNEKMLEALGNPNDFVADERVIELLKPSKWINLTEFTEYKK